MKWKSKKIRTSFVICEECYSRRWLSQPTHLKKICPSKWEASPRFVLKIKHDLEPPPSTSWTFHIWGLVLGEQSFFGVGLDMQPEVVDGSTSVFVSWQKHIQHILLNSNATPGLDHTARKEKVYLLHTHFFRPRWHIISRFDKNTLLMQPRHVI